MVIFHSYVHLPEGKIIGVLVRLGIQYVPYSLTILINEIPSSIASGLVGWPDAGCEFVLESISKQIHEMCIS